MTIKALFILMSLFGFAIIVYMRIVMAIMNSKSPLSRDHKK
jgi:phage shock protein PspC (stress-responsive transcriptional regulator)